MRRDLILAPLGKAIAAAIVWTPVEFSIADVLVAASPPEALPGDDWDGTAASGFSTTPTDPTRTTAKPAVRLITPPDQRFTDTLVVGVMAFANNGGTLIGGLDKVRFHFEGRTVDVEAPTLYTFNDANGTGRAYFGYWVTLKRESTNGEAQLYVEAIPADATMQSRVIGPYSFHLAATLYDEELTVTPSESEVAGSNYQTVGDAIERHRSNSNNATLITITETLTEDPSAWTSGLDYAGDSYCTITATAPVTFAKASYTGDVAGQIRNRIERLHFKGSNITFDMKNVRALWSETGVDGEHWLDGVTFTNSAGRSHLWRSGPRPLAFTVRGNPYFTECDLSELPDVVGSCSLARGCTGTNLYRDFTSDGRCLVYNTIDSLDATTDWLKDVAALEVTYTGAEATATLALAGANDGSSRTFTAAWGANSDTFVVGNTEARYNTATDGAYDATTDGEGYFVQDVADWLNSLTGWSATVVDDTRRASALSRPGAKGIGFAAQDVKNTTLELVTCFDLHGDFYQHFSLAGNAIIAFNQGTGHRGQNLFLGSNSTAPQDFILVNNAFANVVSEVGYAKASEASSQVLRQNVSHVVWAHNSMPNQKFNFRFDNSLGTDGYTLFANNAHPEVIVSGTSDENLTIADNAIDAGETAPSEATGTIIGGNYTSKFADSVNGDFTPAGALLTNLKAPVVARDINGNTRAASDAVGAVAS
jgi:hypothetical protein